jgi:pimeloyl-ACP methyl ester carboxylesterase
VAGSASRGSAFASGAAAVGGVLTAGALAAGGVASVARRLLAAPQPRSAESRVLQVDEAGRRVTFSPTADALVPGRYSFWFGTGSGHARIGEVLERSPSGVARELLGVDVGVLEAGASGRFSGWVHLGPRTLGVPFEDVRVQTTLGAAPAWLVPAERDAGRWAVLVHSRSSVRQEVLRAVPAVRRAGWNSLVISYRNDGEAPRSADARSPVGGREWLDVESAVLAALDRGAEEVVLVGWSLGASLVLETALRTRLASVLTGLVLDSPVLDRADVVRHRQDVALPDPVRRGVLSLVSTRLGARLAARGAPLDVPGLDGVAAVDELRLPMLVLHSDDDGYAPAEGPRRLARERPDLVRLVPFAVAGHGRLWNYDPGRWEGAVSAWLAGDAAALASAGALPPAPNRQRA